MEWQWFFLILLAIILIGILIFLAVWGQQRQNQTDSSTNLTPLTTPVGFLYRCQNITCQAGFGCDPTYGTCKLVVGSPCDLASQCVGDNFCSGVCVGGPAAVTSGAADDPCPCPDDGTMTCSPQTPGAAKLTCKLLAGQTCTQNGQCYSASCVLGQCTAGAANGLTCQADSQCSSGNCSQGWCQAAGVETGTIGAVCVSQVGAGPSCSSGTSCIGGVCSLPAAGLAAFCQTNDDCSVPLSCDSVATGEPCPNDGSAACVCQYNFREDTGSIWRPAPNACNELGSCTSGYSCVTSTCEAVPQQPCAFNANCQSGVCLAQGAIFQLLFTFLDNGGAQQLTPLPNQAFGSLAISWIRVSTQPAPSVGTVSRITANSPSSGSDALYYVIPGAGVFDLAGNNVTPNQPGTPSPTLLIDAVGVSGTEQLLFAYSDGTIWQQDGMPFAGSTDGTQSSGGTTLTISQIDRSSSGDTLLLDSTGALYVLPAGLSSTQWTTATQVSDGSSIVDVSLPRFYSDISTQVNVDSCSAATCPTNNCVGGTVCVLDALSYQNIGFVAADSTYGDVLQFSGNLQGALYPVFDPTRSGGSGTLDKYTVLDQSSWSDPTSGISAGSFVIIATNDTTSETNLFVTPGGSGQAVTAYVTAASKVTGGSQGLYLYTTGICS